MNKRKEALLRRMPTFLYFEKSFKKNGTSIMKKRLSLASPSEPGNFLNCAPLLNKEQEQILFKKLNYLKYRALSTVGGAKWESLLDDEEAMRSSIAPLNAKKLRLAEAFLESAEEVRNTLIKSNTRLIIKPVSRYEKADSPRKEELLSNACVHVMKAVERFDYRRGFKFSTYCVNVIQNNLYRDFQNEKNMKMRFGGEEDPSRPATSVDRPDTRAYDHAFAIKAISSLEDPNQRMVVEGLFGINREKAMVNEIACELGVSRETVRKIKNKAMELISMMPYDPGV